MGMLVCFGVSWPFSILKTLRSRSVAGKSVLFLSIVALGYVCGIIHKLLHAMDAVIYFYIFNLILVLIDLALYAYFRLKTAPVAPQR